MNKFHSKMKQTRYLLYFVTRSFLITVFCFMALIGMFFLFYFGDLLISASKGAYKNPLFGAYIIVSPSMVPTIKKDDAIIIKGINIASITAADINLFFILSP